MSQLGKSLLVVAVTLLFVLISSAQEKRIRRSELPAAVEKTVQSQSQGARIRGFSEEKEGGITYYEVELMVNGHGKDVTTDANGTITEVEEEVPFAQLPPAVKKGLRAKAGASNIVKVESITKQGKLVAYEADVVKAGAKSEVQVGPDGRPLDHEE